MGNITKDKFLLKHVKRNKEGFVSLKLISSFKRVKHLTKDWRQVAVAIEKKSKRLEVNDLKTKVRRLDALPEYDETTPSRTVVALNLPIERPTIEAVAELFSVCGEIVLVRILRPGNPIPADVKPFANKHPEMTDKVCALVEYERTEFAHKAVKDLNKEGEEGMKVMELTAPPPKKTKPSSDDKKKASLASMPSNVKPQFQPQRRFSHAGFGMQGVQMGNGNSGNNEGAQRKESGLNPNAPTFNMQQFQQPQQSHGRRSVRYMPMDAPMMMMQPVLVPNPRRLSAVASGHANLAVSGLALPPNVIRLPRGPSKGKGFQNWCKTRMQPAAPAPSAPVEEQPKVQRKSRAIPVVAPPEGAPAPEEQAEGAVGGAPAAVPAAAAPAPAVNNNLVVNLESSDSDEGHFSDHDLDGAPHENERTR